MLSKFQRPKESEHYVKELDNYLDKMRETLDELVEGRADLNNTKKFIFSLIEEQDENGFWALIPSPKVDGDIRVHYWYEPTYMAAALMMLYYMNYRNEATEMVGFEEALKKGLEASTGRGLKGHGYDDIRGTLEALDILAKGRVIKFIKSFPEISPKFSEMITAILTWLRNSINAGNTKGSWGEDYKAEMEKTLKLLSSEEEIIVFVYGTLMKGCSNHNNFLFKAQSIGNAVVEGFELYDLGSYPGVIYSNAGRVKGELYKIDADTLRRLDALEGEGTLYKRKYTKAVLEDGSSYNAYIYVYNLEVSGRIKIGFENQPWGSASKNEYVWYVSYGSNMLYERFLLYITGGHCEFNGKDYNGCRDKSLPRDSKPITIPYNMYYGNKTSSWGDGGVSFLELSESGKALGRMYLIAREQFEDISRQEGQGSNWYNKVVALGEYEGIKILTITNKVKMKSYAPSDSYLDVVMRGIRETYPQMGSFEIIEYLVGCGKCK